MPDLSRLELAAARRARALAAARAMTNEVRAEALYAYAQGGVMKVEICEAAGVSRMTLDAWLREEEDSR